MRRMARGRSWRAAQLQQCEIAAGATAWRPSQLGKRLRICSISPAGAWRGGQALACNVPSGRRGEGRLFLGAEGRGHCTSRDSDASRGPLQGTALCEHSKLVNWGLMRTGTDWLACSRVD